jgi:hypothetical protein
LKRGEITRTRNIIRNDYTFIKRLEKLVCKYEDLYHEAVIHNYKEDDRYSEIHYNIRLWIKDIKEDMRLRALQKINDGYNVSWNKEYECIFSSSR